MSTEQQSPPSERMATDSFGNGTLDQTRSAPPSPPLHTLELSELEKIVRPVLFKGKVLENGT